MHHGLSLGRPLNLGGLAGSIECGGDGYFSKKVPPTFTCSALLPSLAIALGALNLDLDLPRRACS